MNISGKISDLELTVYDAVHQAASKLRVPYVVVGATARDLVMHHGFGASIQRATVDADFGIEVPDWKAFSAFKQMLIAQGFQETQFAHRLQSPGVIPIDIVPFGGIADQDASIHWPPDDSFKMEVLGFQEACDHALSVCIRAEPDLTIPVASPAGLALMKLIAWKDRRSDLRNKDANDLHYLLQNYEKIPHVFDGLYAANELEELYDWDTELAAAHHLGIHTKQIARRSTAAAIEHVLAEKYDLLLRDISDSSSRVEARFSAFKKGFLGN